MQKNALKTLRKGGFGKMTPEETKNKIYSFLDKQGISEMEKYFVIKMMEQELLDTILGEGEEEAQEEQDDFSEFEDEPEEKDEEQDLGEEVDIDEEPKVLIKKPRVKVVG